jgi:hypothetical protein
VGSYDGNTRLLSTRSWAVAFVLPAAHPAEMHGLLAQGVLPTVEVAGEAAADESSTSTNVFSSFASKSRMGAKSFVPDEKYGNAYVTKSLKSLPQVPADPHAKGGLKLGVNWVGWSGDGQLLAVRAENLPRCLWIWNGIDGQLSALLVQMSAVACARWRPHQAERPGLGPMLAFCTGVSRVYFWTPAGTSWVDIPETSKAGAELNASSTTQKESSVGQFGLGVDNGKILVTSLKWSADGRKIILMGKGAFCTCDISSDDALMGTDVA